MRYASGPEPVREVHRAAPRARPHVLGVRLPPLPAACAVSVGDLAGTGRRGRQQPLGHVGSQPGGAAAAATGAGVNGNPGAFHGRQQPLGVPGLAVRDRSSSSPTASRSPVLASMPCCANTAGRPLRISSERLRGRSQGSGDSGRYARASQLSLGVEPHGQG